MSAPPLDTDSEDEIPAGWEERVTIDGDVYYANHSNQKTQWEHPITGKKKQVTGELPYGWERKLKEDGTVFYVDHLNQKTTFTDPRLAFAEIKTDSKEFKQKFDSNSTALQVLNGRDLTGKYVIVTGANSGIGFETVRALAMHGAHVVMACRNTQSGEACRDKIISERSDVKLEVMHIDLASLSSVKTFADKYKSKGWPLHLLILNAAVFGLPHTITQDGLEATSPLHLLILNAAVFGLPHTITQDGLEATFQVNHLSHFYLVKLLWDIIMKSAPSRVVVVSSESHRSAKLDIRSVNEETFTPSSSKYWDLTAYNLSKLCNVLFSLHLNSLLYKYGVTSLSLHPGNIMYTGLQKNWWFYKMIFYLARPFTKSMAQGAATTVYCSVAPELDGVGGMYFNNCCRCPPSSVGSDDELAKAVWDISEKMLSKRIGRPI